MRPTDEEIAAARTTCAGIVEHRARNFWYGLRTLPEPTRGSLYVVYAWMREVDDIVDTPGPGREDRLAALDRFRARTLAVLGGEPAWSGEPALWIAFADLAARHDLDPEPFEGMIEGQRLDLDWTTCPDRPTLERFCRLVASTVGRICVRIWGHDDAAEVEELANQRGIALQLTNVLRDVREDRERGRVYLPADELAAAGLSIDDLLAWTDAARCRDFVLAQVERAQAHYAAAADLESHLSRSSRGTSWAMGEIYHRILRRIADEPERIVRERVSLDGLEKTRIAMRAKVWRGRVGG